MEDKLGDLDTISSNTKPLDERFEHLIGNPEGADLWFNIVDDACARIPAHKLFVAAGSDVLRRIVYGSDASFLKAVDCIDVDNITSAGFWEILRFLYTDKVRLTSKNVVDILKKSNYYGLDRLELECRQYIKVSVDVENALVFYTALYDLLPFESIAEYCLTKIRAFPIQAAFEKIEWEYCDAAVVKMILSCNIINCDEYVLFEALIKWARAQCQFQKIQPSAKGLRNICNGLQNCIRWSTLTVDELGRILILEPGFYDSKEMGQMRQQIERGTSGSIKRQCWFFKDSNWVVHRMSDPLPPGAVFVGSRYGRSAYVARASSGACVHPMMYYPKRTVVAPGSPNANRPIEVLCGAGYEWKNWDGVSFPENSVVLGVEANQIILVFRVAGEIVSNKLDVVRGILHTDHANDGATEILVANSVFPPLPHNTIPDECFSIGQYGPDQLHAYLGRAFFSGDVLPAVIFPDQNRALVPWNCLENEVNEYEFLRPSADAFEWIASGDGDRVNRSVEGGRVFNGEKLYFGRAIHEGRTVYGKVHRSHGLMYFGLNGVESSKSQYEVLVFKR